MHLHSCRSLHIYLLLSPNLWSRLRISWLGRKCGLFTHRAWHLLHIMQTKMEQLQYRCAAFLSQGCLKSLWWDDQWFSSQDRWYQSQLRELNKQPSGIFRKAHQPLRVRVCQWFRAIDRLFFFHQCLDFMLSHSSQYHSVHSTFQPLGLCWTFSDLHIHSVWLITEQNWLQAGDTTAFLKDCSPSNPKQKINSWINCWACLVNQSFTIIAAREKWRQHVCSYLPVAKLEQF